MGRGAADQQVGAAARREEGAPAADHTAILAPREATRTHTTTPAVRPDCDSAAEAHLRRALTWERRCGFDRALAENACCCCLLGPVFRAAIDPGVLSGNARTRRAPSATDQRGENPHTSMHGGA